MFKKATRSQAKIKLAITGPSGGGKTYSALRLAKGLGGKVAVVDTENGSASLYANDFEFDTATIAPPYTTEKYIEAINGAVKAGYDIVVVDSITHAWSGSGGILQQKERVDSKGGNSYTNWAKVTPKQEEFLATMLHSNINLIATMRSKQEYVLEENDRGKKVPKKVGLAPQQRDGMEYEFTTVFDVNAEHLATVSKDRTKLFSKDEAFQITEKTGGQILDWLNGAEIAPEVPSVGEDAQSITNEVLGMIKGLGDQELKQKIIDSLTEHEGNAEMLSKLKSKVKGFI